MTDLWNPINGVYSATAPLFPWAISISSTDIGQWGSALISAGFGAGAGAWMAGRIARNGKLRDELLAEHRSIDVAMTLCATAINMAEALKKQYLLDFLKKYDSDLERFDLYKSARDFTAPFILNLNNVKLQTITPPIAELQSLIIKDMSMSPNGVRSMTALAEAVVSLNGMIEAYNAILEMFRTHRLPAGFTPRDYYLGHPVKGVSNNEYGSALKAIMNYTNDALFFACKLANCLTAQGVKVSDHFKKVTGEELRVRRFDPFREDANLTPPDSDYEGWMKAWEEDISEVVKTRRWWNRKQT